ncbi:MAG: hypothetical protein RJQ10_10430 [Haliea sp.]|uniref:hypothetical protein n=1 Tax=Haliea sp. TaxID=1932666 RepID=UPI0032F039A8
MRTPFWVAGVLLSAISTVSSADTINSDLSVRGSMCVGAACTDPEDFDFDTLRLRADNPLIKLIDTSNSASFPTNDWSLGITDDGVPGPTRFLIRDETGGQDALVLDPDAGGAVSLGVGSTPVDGAISVGSSGAERRVVHVADGIADTDAATAGQLSAAEARIASDFAAELAADKAALDAEIALLQSEISALSTRLDGFVTLLGLE